MKSTLLLILSAYVMGFLTSIPVGATQIEIAKRSLNHQLRAALMVVFGSACSDGLYGAIALFGLAPFMENETVIAVFSLVTAAILVVLAYFTLTHGTSSRLDGTTKTLLVSGRLSFLTGFSLAATNPAMIIWWLIGAKIIRDLGLVAEFTPGVSVTFVVCGVAGGASYLSLLSASLYRMRRFISEKALHRINFLLGLVLVALALYFVMSALRTLAPQWFMLRTG